MQWISHGWRYLPLFKGDLMSLDLSLRPQKCPTCSHQEEGMHFNITYNLSSMWYYIWPQNEDMLPIDGLTGKMVRPLLELTIPKFIEHKVHLRTLEPKNGWGSLDYFVRVLREMRDACEEHPDWIWECER